VPILGWYARSSAKIGARNGHGANNGLPGKVRSKQGKRHKRKASGEKVNDVVAPEAMTEVVPAPSMAPQDRNTKDWVFERRRQGW
jgi:hypothetical protein